MSVVTAASATSFVGESTGHDVARKKEFWRNALSTSSDRVLGEIFKAVGVLDNKPEIEVSIGREESAGLIVRNQTDLPLDMQHNVTSLSRCRFLSMHDNEDDGFVEVTSAEFWSGKTSVDDEDWIQALAATPANRPYQLLSDRNVFDVRKYRAWVGANSLHTH